MSTQHSYLIEFYYERDPDDRRSERYEEDELYAAGIRFEDIGGEGDLAENIAALGEGKPLETIDEETGKVITARRDDKTTKVDAGTWISIFGQQLEVQRVVDDGAAWLASTKYGADPVRATAEQLAAFGYRVKP